MVRTYAFNPSTQTTATEMLEAFNRQGLRSAKVIPIPRNDHFDHHHHVNNGYPPDWPSTFSHQTPTFSSDQSQTRSSNLIKGRALGNSMASVQSLSSSSASSHASLARSKSQRLAPTQSSLLMEEEWTKVLSIRSVLINGQRFYQPINLSNNGIHHNNRQKQSHKSQHPSDPTPPNAQVHNANVNPDVRVMATAIQMLNGQDNGRQYNANFDNDFFPSPPHQQKQPIFQNAIDNGNVVNRSGQQLLSPAETKQQPSPPQFELQNRNGYGPSTVNHHPQKQLDDQLGIDSPLPWAKGNPQPKSGKRGSDNWNLGQSIGHSHQLNFVSPQQNLLPTIAETNGNGFARPGDSSVHSLGSTYTLPFASNNHRPHFNINSPSISTHSDPAFWTEQAEKEQHKMELLRQIEENKHRKLMEKQREWEQEERERIVNEKYQLRMRQELEDERRREREKALAAERKAAQIAAAQHATEQAIREAQAAKSRTRNGGSQTRIVTSRNGRRASSLSRESDDDQVQRLEWWERKDMRRQEARQKHLNVPSSPIIPALRNQHDEDGQGQNQIANERSKSLGRLNSSSSSERSLGRRRIPSRDQSGKQSRYEPSMTRVDECTRSDSRQRSPPSPSPHLDAIRRRMSARNQQMEHME